MISLLQQKLRCLSPGSYPVPPLNPRSSRGFTIVELLIVIVVIGILAAVTIVAYNGIQQKARIATVQSDLVGAAKTLEVANITSGAYPTTLLLAKLKASPGTVFSYSSGTNPASYSLTATNSGISYLVTNTNTTPTSASTPPSTPTPITIVYSATTNVTVPSAVTSIHIRVAGGTDNYDHSGGLLNGDMVVVPGDVLHVTIGPPVWEEGYYVGGAAEIARNSLPRAAWATGGWLDEWEWTWSNGTANYDPAQVTGVTTSVNPGVASVTLTYTPAS